MNPVLHVVTHILPPELLEKGTYVPSEFVFCGAPDVYLHTPAALDRAGWTAISCISDTLEKLDYAEYVLCPGCVEHPEVALFLLGDLP